MVMNCALRVSDTISETLGREGGGAMSTIS